MALQPRVSAVTKASIFSVSEAAVIGVESIGFPPGFNERPDNRYLRVSTPPSAIYPSVPRNACTSSPDHRSSVPSAPPKEQDGYIHTSRKETESLSQKGTCASVTSSRARSTGSREWQHVSMAYSEEARDFQGSASLSAPGIAFGLSRWTVLGLYCVYCVFSGPAYINWTPIADVLFRAGAFEWLCGGVSTAPDLPLTGDGTAKCENQEAEVNRLFTITAASHFFFSFIGGALLDFIGPKATAVVGLLFGMTGWILLAVANENLSTYIPACLFIGAGLDTTYFPLLSGANLFPGHVATVKAVLGAALSCAFVVPIAIRSVYFHSGGAVHHRLIFCVFACVCLGISLLVALFIVPRRPWPSPYKPYAQRLRDQPLAGGCGVAMQSELRLASSGLGESLEDPEPQEGEVEQDTGRQDREVSYTAVAVPPPSCEEKPSLPVLASLPPATGAVGDSASGRANQNEENEALNTAQPHADYRNCPVTVRPRPSLGRPRQTRPCDTFSEKVWHHLIALRRDICSSVFLPIVPFFCLVLTGVVFFIPSARHLMPDAYAANRIIQIFSFVPCPLFGHIADVWGILPVMYICNLCGLLSFSFVMVPTIPAAEALQFAASLLAAFQLSFLVCQICCYVAETFEEENQGKLIGLLCSAAGATSLAANPIMEYSVRNGFRPALLSFVGGFGFNFFLLLFVHWRKKKTGRVPTKTKVARLQHRLSNAN
uniref:Transporter, major facilitator family protein n=1 Tax=Toxoplasma gondii COUG TaxID=1074873 RepID=A0A2G8XNQ8_TOXGO|nr:transporter, major facilitator family protein [Toxoplasma gondii COUG]